MGKKELVSYSDAPWAVGLLALATDEDDYFEEVHSITSPFLTSPALPSTTAIEIPSHDTERVLLSPSLEDLSPKSLSIDSGALHISSLRRSTRTLKLDSKVVQTGKHPLHASRTGGLTKQRPALLPFRPQLGPLPPLPKYFYDQERLRRRRGNDLDSSHAALEYSDFRQHIMSQIIAPADVDGDNIISVAEILGSGQSQRARQVIATIAKFIAETNSQTMAAEKMSHFEIAASYLPRLRDSHQESQGEAPGYAAPWWEDGPELSLAEYWARVRADFDACHISCALISVKHLLPVKPARKQQKKRAGKGWSSKRTKSKSPAESSASSSSPLSAASVGSSCPPSTSPLSDSLEAHQESSNASSHSPSGKRKTTPMNTEFRAAVGKRREKRREISGSSYSDRVWPPVLPTSAVQGS